MALGLIPVIVNMIKLHIPKLNPTSSASLSLSSEEPTAAEEVQMCIQACAALFNIAAGHDPR